jgi:hypothetical protein
MDVGFSVGVSVELKNTELWADAVENQALRGMVVCIDDLERKEESLSASALLGLITSLRDERSCKVVLLFNETKAAANKEFAPVLAEFREKVIDREILLNPTVISGDLPTKLSSNFWRPGLSLGSMRMRCSISWRPNRPTSSWASNIVRLGSATGAISKLRRRTC